MIFRQTKTTLVVGFLGAGKTTLINALLARKPQQDTWALLINEFGKIGVDGSLLLEQPNTLVKEIGGGCICCSSQLPLQVAMVRLLSAKPSRLLIEPTGLVHVTELLTLLTAPQWQNTLHLSSVICVLNAHQWQNLKYRQHDGYQAHVRCADVVVVNQADSLTDNQNQQLRWWVMELNPSAILIDFKDIDEHLPQIFESCHRFTAPFVKNSWLSSSNVHMLPFDGMMDEQMIQDLPYQYDETRMGYAVGGWQLPAHWMADECQLQKWLLALPNYQRIKGVIRTTRGWITVNISEYNVSISESDEHTHQSLEIILSSATKYDWQRWDKELKQLFVSSIDGRLS